MYGLGILKGLGVTFRHFIDTYVDEIKYAGRKYLRQENFQERQGLNAMGAYTVQYPEEKLAVPERFRFIPFLVVEDPDHPERPGHDWCTSCGICAKVCPPQCIWIVRNEDPVTKRPIPEPQAFYIDIDICMNCGFCAEFCPFDAIKMDHDYELASYDRTGHHIYDKQKLSKPFSYWMQIAPTTAWEEARERGGWHHSDVLKEMKKQGKSVAPVDVGYETAVGKVKVEGGAVQEAVAEAVEVIDEEAIATQRLARRAEAAARYRAKAAARG